MAGIAGYLGTAQAPDVIRAMVRKLSHRGDGEEIYYVSDYAAMGAQKTGAGPDAPGQLVYNDARDISVLLSGSVDNLAEERRALAEKGIACRDDSAAELVLQLYQAFGVNAANHLRGMFVFVIHDTQKDLVLMARDRMGQQPLYYTTTQAGIFVFASEIKSLLQFPAVQVNHGPIGVDAFLTMGFSPGPETLFKGIHKLPPGHRLSWNPGLHIMIEPYWQWEGLIVPPAALKTPGDFQDEFDRLFEDAVRRSIGDSGGVAVVLSQDPADIAVAAAAAKHAAGRPVHGFSIHYGDAPPDPLVEKIAAALGIRHHAVACPAAEMEKLPELIWALDEPIADPAILSSYLLSRAALPHATLMLDGSGADELLSAHPFQKMLSRAISFPRFFLPLMRLFVKYAPQSVLERRMDCIPRRIGAVTRRRVVDFISSLTEGDVSQQYLSLLSVFSAQEKAALYGPTLAPAIDIFVGGRKQGAAWPSALSAALAAQMDYILPDKTLRRTERMAAYNGVRPRMPFADHHLVEFMLGLPETMKCEAGRDKIMLRDWLARHVPDMPRLPPQSARPEFPLADFLVRGAGAGLVSACLSEASVKRRGLFSGAAVENLLSGTGKGDHAQLRQVFALLTLELWFRIFVAQEKGWLSA